MKKVVGIFLTMVFVFVVLMANVYATEIANISASEGYAKVREWAEIQGWSPWYNEESDDFVVFGYGAVSVETYERETGLSWTMENFEKSMIEQNNLCECRIRQVGEIDGNNVYLIEAQSETQSIGSRWNDETEMFDSFYCASVLFMVCEYD